MEGPAVPQPSHITARADETSTSENTSVLSVSSVVKPASPQPSHQTEVKELSSRPKQSEAEQPAVELSSRPERSEVEGPAVPQPSHELTAGKNLDHRDGLSVPSEVKNAFPQPEPGTQSLTFTPMAAEVGKQFQPELSSD